MNSATISRNAPNSTGSANRDGFAMVTALLVVLVLSVLAVGATWLAASEKKTSVAEASHMRSVFAADAGGEAGINFVRTSDDPPLVLDWSTMSVQTLGETALDGSQAYGYDIQYVRWRAKPGWGREYRDFDYRVAAIGDAGTQGQSGVSVLASRVYKTGY